MMVTNLIAIWRSTALLALTVSQRWAAARQLRTNTPVVPAWLIIAAVVALIILVASALVNRYKQGPH